MAIFRIGDRVEFYATGARRSIRQGLVMQIPLSARTPKRPFNAVRVLPDGWKTCRWFRPDELLWLRQGTDEEVAKAEGK